MARPSRGGPAKGRRPTAFWRRHTVGLLICAAILVAGLAGLPYWLHARHFERTTDAYIDARPVSVIAEVSGAITDVPVTDNQLVHAGDELIRIDQRNYTAAFAQAEAQIDAAQAALEGAAAQIDVQRFQVGSSAQQVAQAAAALTFSQDQDIRAQQLVATGSGTAQTAQQAASDLKQKEAALSASVASRQAANEQGEAFQARRREDAAQIEQGVAQKLMASADLTRTVIHATVDGRVTRLVAAQGMIASAGEVLLILVPRDVWVTAYFEETQLRALRVGQPVDVTVEAYGRTFAGRIDSIQAGSGTAYSLLPAEDATENYVKVVQRIPVKITFDQRPDVEIGPGMQVVARVRVR